MFIDQSLYKDQPYVNYDNGKIIVGWLWDIKEEKGFHRETVDHALELLSMVLRSDYPIQRTQFQLVSLVCLWIAFKFNEEETSEVIMDAIECSDLTARAYTVKEVLCMEMLILKLLEWRVWTTYGIDKCDKTQDIETKS